MDLSDPASIAFGAGDAGVLRVLARTTRALSGREIARLSGRSSSTTWRSLKRLAEHGLVGVQEVGAGAALLYTLNRDHLAADAVTALVDLRRCLIAKVKNELESWQVPPKHASLFGSAARGDGSTESDIDIFIVRSAGVEGMAIWEAQIERLSRQVRSWTGNRASVLELSESELFELRTRRPPVADEIVHDAIVLIGQPIQTVLGTAPT